MSSRTCALGFSFPKCITLQSFTCSLRQVSFCYKNDLVNKSNLWIHSTKRCSMAYWKILATLNFTALCWKRISYRTIGYTVVVCGPKLELLNFYLWHTAWGKAFCYFYFLILQIKFTLAASILHYLNMYIYVLCKTLSI